MRIHRYKLITNYITLRNITKITIWKYNDKKGTLQITLITLHKIYRIHSKNTITKLNTQYATNYDMDYEDNELENGLKTCWRFLQMYTFCRRKYKNLHKFTYTDKKGTWHNFTIVLQISTIFY